MDTPVRYQVVFSGKLRKGCNAADVKRDLARRLRQPMEKIERLFNGERAVLKQTASQEEARRIVMQLATSTGAIATIEPSGKAPAAKKPAAVQRTVSESPAEHKPFAPLRQRYLLKPLLMLGAAREIVLNLLHIGLILALLGLVLMPSLFGDWAASFRLPITLLAGLLLLLLLKPLLALFHTEKKGIPLDPEQEPDLHAFVEDICGQIGAPVPVEIRLQEAPEIHVAYQGPQGWLKNQTELTLGVPLVAGLTSSQLAALLAYHLSPYRRKAAPRAAAILLHDHAWLQASASGNDIVDRTLQHWDEEGKMTDSMFRLIQLLIVPARKMVGWRLRLSRALDRTIVHRIVAEADRLALTFTDKNGFIRMLDQSRLLAFVGSHLQQGLEVQWHEKGVLPGNMIQLMVMRSRQFPVEMPKKLRLAQERDKAASDDTLPSDRQRLERIANATDEADNRCLSSATVLFSHYRKLTRTMTLRYYHHRLRLPVSPYRLQQVYGKKSLEHIQQQRLDGYFNRLYVDFLPLRLRHRTSDLTVAEAQQQWHAALAHCKSDFDKAKQARAHFNDSEAALVETSTTETIHLAGLWRQWGEAKLGNNELEEVHQSARDSEQEYQRAARSLEQYLKNYAIRLSAVLGVLNQQQAQALAGAKELKQEVQQLLATLELIDNVNTQLRELKLQTLLLETLLTQRTAGKNQKLEDRIEQQSADVQQLTRAIGFTLKIAPYPFNDRKGGKLIDYVLQNALTEETPQGIFDRGYDTVEVLAQVQRRALVRLIVIAGQLEKALGFAG